MIAWKGMVVWKIEKAPGAFRLAPDGHQRECASGDGDFPETSTAGWVVVFPGKENPPGCQRDIMALEHRLTAGIHHAITCLVGFIAGIEAQEHAVAVPAGDAVGAAIAVQRQGGEPRTAVRDRSSQQRNAPGLRLDAVKRSVAARGVKPAAAKIEKPFNAGVTQRSVGVGQSVRQIHDPVLIGVEVAETGDVTPGRGLPGFAGPPGAPDPAGIIENQVFPLRELRAAAGTQAQMLLALVGDPEDDDRLPPLRAFDFTDWQRKIDQMADPYLRLEMLATPSEDGDV